MNGFWDPMSNCLVKSLLEAGKRLNSSPIKQKDTINTEIFITLSDLFRETNDALHLRDLTMILFVYAGFLRFREISQLRCNDVDFKDEYVTLQIRCIWKRSVILRRFIFRLSTYHAL